ncbi:MAG: hypothetical protein IJF87_05985 [Erysipelotrichaceae bacterium]|nr:hypothetical protein [Erysipelotrichaceae bacterium]
MELKQNEFVYEASEFENYYVFGIQKKDNFFENKLIPGSGRTIAISKKNKKEYEYHDEESLYELHLNFGRFIKELDEDEIELVLKKVK